MKMLVRAALVGALLSAPAHAAFAQDAGAAYYTHSTLNLSAEGEARVAPDMATINLGVMTEAQTASVAMDQNAARMNAVIAALRRAGIEERNIQTSSLNLNAQYDYRQNESPVLRGYRAENQVTIRVLDLDRLGQALDAVVAAGSNQINGISFGLQDPTEAENRARMDAVRALREKADLYAAATDHRITRMLSLSEGGGYAPQPPMPMMAARNFAVAESATPVQSGEMSVKVNISAVYLVAPNRPQG